MGRNVCVIVFVIVMVVQVESSLHRVGGGKYTWNSDVNLSDWSNNERVYSGDWLYFGFDKTRHNVLQVNKTSYEQCIDKDFIFNITRGGRDVFQLLQPKPYYFICGKGYCHKGMKLVVNVLPQVPQPPPSLNSTAPFTLTSTAITLIPSTALATTILTFTFKALYSH